mgnify:CR=1 FL=1
MKTKNRFTRGLVMTSLALALAPGLHAQNSKDGYVQDARGVIVRNSNFGDPRIGNLCWRTGYWTPQMANCECDEAIVGRNICNPPPAAIPVAAAAPPAPPAATPKPPPPAPAPTAVAQKTTFSMDAFFDFDKSVLKPEARAKLDDLVNSIKGINLDLVIAVGHTDAIGSNAYNQKLSIRRAEAVKAYLVGKGIDAGRIQAGGKGETAPIADNLASEGRARNRRVEIEVVGTRAR